MSMKRTRMNPLKAADFQNLAGTSGIPDFANPGNVGNIPKTDFSIKTLENPLIKWIPLICAGTAIGVGIIALKEIKNVRKDLILMKKEQVNSEVTDKIERMDEQLRKITEYLTNQNKSKPTNSKNENVINQALKKNVVNIINDDVDDSEREELSDDEKEELVEVEVTDDEN